MTDDTIRLACFQCDTDSGDGITMREALADGWMDIGPDGCPEDDDAWQWWDYIGECPECISERTNDER